MVSNWQSKTRLMTTSAKNIGSVRRNEDIGEEERVYSKDTK